MSNPNRPIAAVITGLSIALAAAACSGSAPTPSPVGSPGQSAAPNASPSAEVGIEHPTGASDVVFRISSGGGFVMPAFVATAVPHFTLYGDGTIIFRNLTEAPPSQAPNSSVIPGVPLRIARMSEAQVGELLEFVLGPGGLASARPKYENQMVADAGTTTFEVHAGGVDKTVEIYGLGIGNDMPDTPDLAARKAFQSIVDRLGNVDQGGVIPTEVYRPKAYRGILMDAGQPAVPDIREWPWPGIKPADFTIPADPNGVGLPRRTMTPADATPLALGEIPGGAQAIFLKGEDGKFYELALRPLLPDEKE